MEERSKLIMKGMSKTNRLDVEDEEEVVVANKKQIQHRSRTQSPGKSQGRSMNHPNLSPVRTISTAALHGIREEFSPSPVCPVSARQSLQVQKVTRNVFDNYTDDCLTKKIPMVDVLKVKSKYYLPKAKHKNIEPPEESPDNPRQSISFQPTPSRFKSVKKSSESQSSSQESQEEEDEHSEEAEDLVFELPERVPFNPSLSRPSDADLGFKFPSKPPSEPSEIPQKPPSETSEVTFKMPTVPQVNRLKRKEPPEEPQDMENRYLHTWIPRLKKDKLYIEGDLLDLDTTKDSSSEMSSRYMTSRIVRRISSNVIGTKKRIYVLEGPLAIKDIEEELKHQTPQFIMDRFKFGFPENWDRLVKHWTRLENQNKKNYENSLISSTLLSNLSTFGNTTANFTNLSAITSINCSGLIKNKPRNLSINKQPDISVLPEKVQKKTVLDVVSEEALDIAEDLKENNTVAFSEPPEDLEKIPGKSKKNKGSRQKKDMDMDVVSEEVLEITEILKESTVVCSEVVPVVEPNDVDDEFSAEEGNENETVKEVNDFKSKSKNPGYRGVGEVLPEKEVEISEDESKAYFFYCKACKFATNSTEDFADHRALKTHKAKMYKVNNGATNYNPNPKPKDTLQCRLCDYSTWRDDNFRAHCNSKKHLDRYTVAMSNMAFVEKVPELSKNSILKESLPKVIPVESEDDVNPSKIKSSKTLKNPTKSKSSSYNDDKKEIEENDFVQPIIPPIGKKSKGKGEKASSQTNNTKSKSKEPTTEGPEKNPQGIVTNSKEDAKTSSSTEDEMLNQSRFGRVRKQNAKYIRQSCVYNTPEEPQENNGKSKIVKTIIPKKLSRKKTVEKPQSEDSEGEESRKPKEIKKSKIKGSRSKRKDSSIESKNGNELLEELDENQVKLKNNNGSKNDKTSRKKKIQQEFHHEDSEEDFVKAKKSKKSAINEKVASKKRSSKEAQVNNEPPVESEEILIQSKKTKGSKKDDKITSKKRSSKKGQREESLRRTVLNPFKKISESTVIEHQPTKDVGEILKKVSAKPKTVKERIQNSEALKEFNENHEDDVFDIPTQKSSVLGNLKVSTKSTLLNQDPDSDSDQDISVHSARTPVTGKGYSLDLSLRKCFKILIF